MARYATSTEPLFTELVKHMLPSDIEELRSIVTKIETKIETKIADSRKRFPEE